MPSIITERFIACHDHLKQNGTIRSSRQFAQELSYHPQNLNEIIRGKRDAPADLIRSAVEKYRINPLYLYLGEGSMFLDDQSHEPFRILTVVTDFENEEKILHVNVPAQAGYCGEQIDKEFLGSLPCYSLPDPVYRTGTYRSFDVAGDSMEPSLQDGDRVICRFIEYNDWLSGIKDQQVYVVVTRSGVLVKRVVNNLQKHRHLELISDNCCYRSTRINWGEIREVWHVQTRISRFSHRPPTENHDPGFMQMDELRQALSNQSKIIQDLNETLQQFIGTQTV